MFSPRTLLAPAALALFAGLAGAQTTWYVDAVNGLDSNAGTSPALAFQTITWGTNMAMPGDTVMVLPGVYSYTLGETFPIGPIRGIRVLGADPRTTIIDPEVLYPPTPGTYGGDIVQIQSDSIFSGFTVRNGPHGTLHWWSGAIHIDEGTAVSNVVVERCIIDRVNRAFYIGNPWNSILTNIIVRNNFMIRCSSDAIGMWGDQANPSSGNQVYNNTIVGGVTGHVTRDAIFIDNGCQADIYNNIIYAHDYNGIEMGGTGNNIGRGWNNNIFLHTGTFGGTYAVGTASTWSMTGDTYVDPLFVDNGADMHLAYNSPCIDAGDPTMTSTSDIDGEDISGSAIDQGCDERMMDFREADLYLWPSVEGGVNTTFTYLGQPGDYSVAYTAAILSISGPINLGAMGILYIDPLGMFGFGPVQTLDASGIAQVSVPVPATPYFLGVSLYYQGINFPPAFTSVGISNLEEIVYGM